MKLKPRVKRWYRQEIPLISLRLAKRSAATTRHNLLMWWLADLLRLGDLLLKGATPELPLSPSPARLAYTTRRVCGCLAVGQAPLGPDHLEPRDVQRLPAILGLRVSHVRVCADHSALTSR